MSSRAELNDGVGVIAFGLAVAGIVVAVRMLAQPDHDDADQIGP